MQSNREQQLKRRHEILNPKHRERKREVRCNRENEQRGKVGEGVEIQLHPCFTATPCCC